MKITFILPVYNAQATIALCLKSLICQKYRAEIIVIDDCSTDNTFRILQSFKDDIILFENEERKGAAWCRNFGNSKASEPVIAVCDADVYYKDRSKAIKEFFMRYKSMDVFYSALHTKEPRNIYDKSLCQAYEWDFKSKCPISHPTIAYRKKVTDKIKYKELSIETDLYEFFLLDAHKAGFKFGWTQNPLMLKFEGSSVRNKDKAWKLKRRLYKEYGITI